MVIRMHGGKHTANLFSPMFVDNTKHPYRLENYPVV